MPANTSFDDEEEEGVLELSEQTNRPKDVALHQQRVRAWHPILHPEWVVYTFLVLAVIFIPSGFKMKDLAEDVMQLDQMYDSHDTTQLKSLDCAIGTNYNAKQTCQISFEVTKDVQPPLLVYYQLDNFHQNHRFYASSRSNVQLTGSPGELSTIESALCEPMYKLGDKVLNPCGLIANTFFNDVISLAPGILDADGEELVMSEKGIAWQSDIEYRFKQPDGFETRECPEGQCDASCCQLFNFSCTTPVRPKDDNSICLAYHYPFADTTQYLHDTYPDVISPLDGVTDEHFIVWMRIATLPKFRKLYGHIQQPIAKGTILTFDVTSNFVVESFRGSKTLIVSTTTIFGGDNPTLGLTFIAVGFFCLFMGLFFAAKHWLKPRKIGSPKYLQYKED